MEPTTRPSLVLRLRDPEDSAAWAEFVDIYEPLIYRLAVNKGLQDADAQDLCQDVFRAVAAAMKALGPRPGEGAICASGCFAFARNLVVNFLVAQRRQERGTGSTSVQEMLESQPAGDPRPPRSSRRNSSGVHSAGRRIRFAMSSRNPPGRRFGKRASKTSRWQRSPKS